MVGNGLVLDTVGVDAGGVDRHEPNANPAIRIMLIIPTKKSSLFTDLPNAVFLIA
jgi:hypothetical protein